MTRLISRVYHYLTDDISGELEVSDSSVWIKTHEETEQ